MNRNYLICLLLLWSGITAAELERKEANYGPDVDDQKNKALCRERYQQELEFTEQKSLATLKGLYQLCDVKAIEQDVMRLKESLKSSNVDINRIAQDYRHIMESLASCRSRALLSQPTNIEQLKKNSGGLEHSKRIFLHVLGDAFGRNTGLEGSYSNFTLNHRIDLLKEIIQSIGGKDIAFINDKDHAEPCFRLPSVIKNEIYANTPKPDISHKFLTAALNQSQLALELYELSRGPSLQKFRDRLKSELQKLENGQSLYFPTSWSGHAIVFEMVREDENHITFKMFNSGEGINVYHAALLAGDHIKYFPYVARSKVPLSSVTSFVNLSALKEVYAPKGETTKPRDFYDRFLLMLGGEKMPPPYTAKQYEKPQIAGTCTYASLPWVMSSCLAANISQDFRSENNLMSARLEDAIRLVTLNRYGTMFEASASFRDNEEGRNLLEKGLAYTSSKLIDSLVHKTMSQGEMTSVLKRLMFIKADFTAAQKTAQQKERLKTKEFTLANLSTTAFPKLPDLPDLGGKSSIEMALLNPSPDKNISAAPSTVIVTIPTPFSADKNKLQEELAGLYGQMEKMVNDKKPGPLLKVMWYVEDISRALPLKNDFWQGMSAEQGQKIISLLADFSKLYLYCLMSNMANNTLEKQQVSMPQFLTVIKFLTVADYINKNYIKILPSMYSETWGQIFTKDMVVNTIKDPRWQEQFQQIKEYYKQHDEKDFFGFDIIPTGSGYHRRIYVENQATAEIASASPKDIRYEDEKYFKDREWVINLIKSKEQTPQFKEWQEKSSKMISLISPHRFMWKYEGGLTPPPPKPSHLKDYPPVERKTLENFIQFQSAKIIAGLMKIDEGTGFLVNEIGLFQKMRSMAIAADLILTGNISNFSPNNMSLSKGVTYEQKKVGSVTVEHLHEMDQESRYKNYKTTSYSYLEGRPIIFGQEAQALYSSQDSITVEFPRDKTLFNSLKPWYHLYNSDSFHRYDWEVISRDVHPRTELEALFNKSSYQYKRDPRGREISPFKNRITANQVILQNPKSVQFDKIGLEQMRSIFNLLSSQKFQADKTLSYFLYRPYLLSEDRDVYRLLFEKLMFDPDVWQNELSYSKSHQKAFFARLAQFCHTMFKNYTANSDLRASAFILQMNDLFKLYAENSKAEFDQFINTQDEFVKLIDKLTPEQKEQRSYLYKSLAQIYLYRSPSTNDDIVNLLVAVMVKNMTPIIDAKFANKEHEQKIKNILIKHQDRIIHELKQSRDKILNAVVARLLPEQKGVLRSWNNVGELIFNSNSEKSLIALDVVNGNVFVDGQIMIPFPISIDEYRKLFGSTPPSSAKQINDSVYEWTDPKSGDLVRAFVGPKEYYSENYYMRFSDNQWFFLIQPVWPFLAKLKNEDSSSRTVMVHDAYNWMVVSEDPQIHQGKILVTDSKTGNKKLMVNLSSNQVENISRTDNAKLLNVLDLNKQFAGLDDGRYVYVWGDEPNRVQEVELYRLGLKFKAMPGSDTLDCANFDEYQVARHQYVPQLGEPKNYLVCEQKKAGSEKPNIVLMVAQKFSAQQMKKSLMTSDFINQRDEKDEKKDWSQSLMVYRLKGDHIEPQNKAAQYYLALYYLWQQKYDKSRELIDVDGSVLAKLKDDEEEILHWISSGNSDDHDARSFAVRLTALIALGKDFFNYHDDPQLYGTRYGTAGKFEKLLHSNRALYDAYLDTVDTVATSKISFKNELLLADWYVSSSYSDFHDDDAARSIENKRLLNRRDWLKSVVVGAIPKTMTLSYQTSNIKTEKPAYVALQASDLNHLKSYFKHMAEHTPFESSALKIAAGHIMTFKNFKLFCHAATGILSNEQIQEARVLLKEMVGNSYAAEIDGLSQQDLITELLSLVRVATIKPGDRQEEGPWEVAQMIMNFFMTKPALHRPWEQLFSYLDPKKMFFSDEDRQALLKQFPELRAKQSALTAAATQTFVIPPQHTDIAVPLKLKVSRVIPPDFSKSQSEKIDDPLAQSWPHDTLLAIFDERLKYKGDNTELDKAYSQMNSELDRMMMGAQLSTDIKAAIATLISRIMSKHQTLKQDSKQYVVKDWALLLALKADVEAKKNNVTMQKENLEATILDLARKYDPTVPDANYHELLKLATIEHEVTLNDVLYLLLTNKLASFYALNGSITASEAELLRHHAVKYVVTTTAEQHLKHILVQIQALLKLQSKPENDSDVMLATHELITSLTSKRAYTVPEHVEYVVFEHFSEKLLRPAQVLALNQLGVGQGHIESPQKLGAVLELIMGAGKTSVIVPLMLALSTDDDLLNVVVLPESLITSMAEELSHTLGRCFKRHIDVMIFGQGRELKTATISLIKDRLYGAHQEKRSIVTTNSSLQSLFLHFINRLDGQDGESLLRNQPRQELKEIFKLFREHGRLIIDEVDLALDIMRAQQIAVGNKLAIKEVIKHTIASFYQLIASDPDIYTKFALPFLPYSNGVPLSDKTYPLLKQQLIEKLVTMHDSQSFLTLDRELNSSLVTYLKKYGSEQLQSYLSGPTKGNRQQVLQNISDARLDERLKDVVAILAEELNGVFELTVLKKLNVHYGPLPKPIKTQEIDENLFKLLQGEYEKSRFVAIPYRNSTPLVQSRFAADVEQVNYTLQKDLNTQDFAAYIGLEIEAIKKLGAGSPNFYKLYQKIAGSFASIDIEELTPEHIRRIADTYKGAHKVSEQIRLIKNHALAQISSYQRQLQTNAQIYEFMFKIIYGLSGTLWSFSTFPDVFSDPILSDTSPLTILLLLSMDASILPLAAGNLPQQIAQIYQDWPVLPVSIEDDFVYAGWWEPGSLIDEGGIFSQYRNQEVAEAIVNWLVEKNIPAVEGVIYYDDNDNIVIMDKNKLSTALSHTTIPLEKRIAYWDKKHTTGSDLKLLTTMKAKMTVDVHIKLRDIEQAGWRLRKLGQGQKVTQYISPENDLAMIRSTLNSVIGKTVIDQVKPVHLIAYSVLNQQEQLSSLLNWRAFSQRLKNKLIKVAMGDVLNVSISSDESAKRYKENGVAGLFAQVAPEHVFEIYGLPAELMKKDQAMQQEENQITARRAFKTYNTDQRIAQQLSKVMAHDQANLPDKIMMPRSSQQGTELQIELNLQTQTQTQRQTQSMQYDPNRQAPEDKVLNWNLSAKGEQVFYPYFFEPEQNQLIFSSYSVENGASPRVLGHLFSLLDKNFYFSANWAPLYDRRFAFYDQHAKELSEVLIYYKKSDKKYSVIALDNNDVEQWKDFLAHDQEAKSPRTLQIGIYSLLSDQIIAEGAEPFDQAKLAHNDQLQLLLVQAKFLAGVLSYTKEQQIILKNWILDSNIGYMREYFKSYILSYKDISQKEYITSFIAELFGDQT